MLCLFFLLRREDVLTDQVVSNAKINELELMLNERRRNWKKLLKLDDWPEKSNIPSDIKKY